MPCATSSSPTSPRPCLDGRPHGARRRKRGGPRPPPQAGRPARVVPGTAHPDLREDCLATSLGCRIFGEMYRPADGTDEVRKPAREQLAAGADFVKVMATGARSVVLENPETPQLTREEVRAVVEEAHRLGKRVAAHAEGLEGSRSPSKKAWTQSSTASRCTVSPPCGRDGRERPDACADPVHLPRRLRGPRGEGPVRAGRAGRTPARGSLRSLAAAKAAGVRTPWASTPTRWVRTAGAGQDGGRGIHADGGDVAATSNAAAALGLGDLGAVIPGAVADLIVLDGDPLSEPAVLLDFDRIRFIVPGGGFLAAAPSRRREHEQSRLSR